MPLEVIAASMLTLGLCLIYIGARLNAQQHKRNKDEIHRFIPPTR